MYLCEYNIDQENYNIIKFYVRSDNDNEINTKNNEGKTALNYFSHNNYNNIINFLGFIWT